MQIEKEQIKQIHTILARMGKANEKSFKMELVQDYTNKRETSTTGLTYEEATAMIADLNRLAGLTPDQIKANAKRWRILAYAHQMGWEVTGGKVDIARVDGWCIEYGYLHKALNDYSLVELSKLVWQMEMVYKSYLTSI